MISVRYFIFVACIILLPTERASGSLDDLLPAQWQTRKNCGVNSLYLFLRLRGIDAEYGNVRDEVAVSDRGSSLRDMLECAKRHDLNVSTVKAPQSHLEAIECPFIAHLSMGGVDGHYVVVVSVEEDMVACVDGSTLKQQLVPVDRFRRDWTGFALANATGRLHSSPQVVNVGLSAIAFMSVLFIVARRRHS